MTSTGEAHHGSDLSEIIPSGLLEKRYDLVKHMNSLDSYFIQSTYQLNEGQTREERLNIEMTHPLTDIEKVNRGKAIFDTYYSTPKLPEGMIGQSRASLRI